jgi:CTP-dependent riboflavin kinase
VVVVLGVSDARTTRGHLHVSALHRLDVSHAVLVRQLARHDVAEDLGLSMRVRGEASTGSDSVLVDHSQGAKVLEGRVVIVGKGEGVEGLGESALYVGTRSSMRACMMRI